MSDQQSVTERFFAICIDDKCPFKHRGLTAEARDGVTQRHADETGHEVRAYNERSWAVTSQSHGPEHKYIVSICVGSVGSLWRELAVTPGFALDAAVAKRMHNNPDEPPTHFVVTPEDHS